MRGESMCVCVCVCVCVLGRGCSGLDPARGPWAPYTGRVGGGPVPVSPLPPTPLLVPRPDSQLH